MRSFGVISSVNFCSCVMCGRLSFLILREKIDYRETGESKIDTNGFKFYI